MPTSNKVLDKALSKALLYMHDKLLMTPTEIHKVCGLSVSAVSDHITKAREKSHVENW